MIGNGRSCLVGLFGPTSEASPGVARPALESEPLSRCFCTADEWLAHPATVGRPFPKRTFAFSVPTEMSCRAEQSVRSRHARRRSPTSPIIATMRSASKSDKVGFFVPGDIGYVDEDGFFYLCDRAKDLVISSGVNIYPAEIEAELHKMPGVADSAHYRGCVRSGFPRLQFRLSTGAQPSSRFAGTAPANRVQEGEPRTRGRYPQLLHPHQSSVVTQDGGPSDRRPGNS